ncbi:MAG: hypothetical protein WCV90_00610 [Candidatus Woesearchaeota archaeon]|jgi:hypothetical protein
MIKNYLNSFKPKKELFYPFLLDVIAITLIVLLLIGYGTFLQSRSDAITGGKSVDEVKAMLLSGSEEYNQQFLAKIQVIGLIFFGGGLLFILASLFIYSLSSRLEWNFLLKKQTKYWRWNGLTLMMSLFSLLVALFYAGFNLLIGLIFSSDNYFFLLFVRLIGILVILAFVSYCFLASYSFNHTYRVWHSVGEGFSLVKKEWTKLWKVYLFSVFTFILLNILIYLITLATSIGETAYSLLGASVSLLFFSWMRYYYLKSLFHHD